MYIAICRLTLHSRWIFPVRLLDASHEGAALAILKSISNQLPCDEHVVPLYLIPVISGTVAAQNLTSSRDGVFFNDFSLVLKDLVASSIDDTARDYALDQYRLDSFLQGHRYYKSGSRVTLLTEADLRRTLLKSRQSFQRCFQMLHDKAVKILDELHMGLNLGPFSYYQILLNSAISFNIKQFIC